LEEGDAAPRSLAITFDDGFAGVYEFAFPLLSELGVAGAVFIITEPGSEISETRLFHFEVLEIAFRLSPVSQLDATDIGIGIIELSSSQNRARGLQQVKHALKAAEASAHDAAQQSIIEQLGVSDDEIISHAQNSSKYRKLSATQITSMAKSGWTIGGHTRTHRALSSLSDIEVAKEITGNLTDLRSHFGVRNPPFAYPYGTPQLIGTVAPEVVRQSGFSFAFTTTAKACEPLDDRFQLGRFSDSDLLFRSRNLLL
jgi:peptidoglycan/xylan/chitin deacetylase (PgdA/CDA1 family)